MKLAITYEKETGNIFQHFGKTQYFKIYQIEDGKILSSEVIDNGGNGHHAIPPYFFAKGELKPNFEAKCNHHGEHHN